MNFSCVDDHHFALGEFSFIFLELKVGEPVVRQESKVLVNDITVLLEVELFVAERMRYEVAQSWNDFENLLQNVTRQNRIYNDFVILLEFL